MAKERFELSVLLPSNTNLPLGVVPGHDSLWFSAPGQVFPLPPEKQTDPDNLLVEYKEDGKPSVTGYLSVGEKTRSLVISAMKKIPEVKKLLDEKSSPTVKQLACNWTSLSFVLQDIENLPPDKQALLQNIYATVSELIKDNRFTEL